MNSMAQGGLQPHTHTQSYPPSHLMRDGRIRWPARGKQNYFSMHRSPGGLQVVLNLCQLCNWHESKERKGAGWVQKHGIGSGACWCQQGPPIPAPCTTHPAPLPFFPLFRMHTHRQLTGTDGASQNCCWECHASCHLLQQQHATNVCGSGSAFILQQEFWHQGIRTHIRTLQHQNLTAQS